MGLFYGRAKRWVLYRAFVFWVCGLSLWLLVQSVDNRLRDKIYFYNVLTQQRAISWEESSNNWESAHARAPKSLTRARFFEEIISTSTQSLYYIRIGYIITRYFLDIEIWKGAWQENRRGQTWSFFFEE